MASRSARPHRMDRGTDQPDPGGLQPLGQNAREPLSDLVPELGFRRAGGSYRLRVEFEGLDRAGGYGAEGPPVRWEPPRPAEQLTQADGVDPHPALPGNVQVQGHRAGLEQPEMVGAATLLEKPMPGREGDVRGGVGEH